MGLLSPPPFKKSLLSPAYLLLFPKHMIRAEEPAVSLSTFLPPLLADSDVKNQGFSLMFKMVHLFAQRRVDGAVLRYVGCPMGLTRGSENPDGVKSVQNGVCHQHLSLSLLPSSPPTQTPD